MPVHLTLYLSLKKAAFDVMVTGEKPIEFRKPGQWINSRLFNKDGSKKKYDRIKFTNGYGPGKPFFICAWNGFVTNTTIEVTYSNGLTVNDSGLISIVLGRIIYKGNIK